MRHPVAWWLWALGLVAAASRGTNPWVSVLIILGAAAVAATRRHPDSPAVLRLFLTLAMVAAVIRVVSLVLLGSGTGSTVLLNLPSVEPVPGIRLGGPLTAQALYAVGLSTLQLSAILICLGAASELGPPRRLLTHLPASLYEVGTAVTVALTCAPQVADHARAVHTARRLRAPAATTGRLREFAHLAPPVLDAALDRSLALAAAMECRGFSHHTGSRRSRRLETLTAMAALAAIIIGTFGLLNDGEPTPATVALLGAGVIALLLSLRLAGRSGRTRYRRDPWGTPEVLLLLGAAAAVVGGTWSAAAEPELMTPPMEQFLPMPPLAASLGVLVALGCALSTPAPTR